MSDRNFCHMLREKWASGKFVCVGLDPDHTRLPACVTRSRNLGNAMLALNAAVVNATSDLVCAYKPNIAFYASHGAVGLRALWMTIRHIKENAPDIPIILDAKRGDIGNTNNGYAAEAFDEFGADAITVHPYSGREALAPFLARKDKGIFVLCRTSSPEAGEFQDISVGTNWALSGSMPLYQYVAFKIARDWNEHGNVGLVVGATAPEELGLVRRLVGDMPILIPGIGAQGGNLKASVKAGRDNRGQGFIVNASRSIIFASAGDDFAEAARAETERLHKEIEEHRGERT